MARSFSALSSFWLGLLLIGGVSFADAISPEKILKKADDIRMPGGDARVQAKVVSKRPDGRQEEAVYDVLMKGREKTLIKTLSPASDRGTSILMLGRDLWVFLPHVSKPVRVALQQRLMGDVANGDLARANFSGDYKPSLVKEGTTFYELKLQAVSDDVTYGQVRLWVDKKTGRPLRAAFYAASGRLLKIGHYQGYRLFSGILRPSRLLFEDAVEKGKRSTIYYNEITSESFPEKLFTKDYLKKLKY